MKLQSIAKETAACHADGLREAADAALTEFVDEHGSDFDAQYWPGMAAIRAALQSSLLWLRRGRELSEPRPDAVPALDELTVERLARAYLPTLDALTAARLYDALWLLKASRNGDDAEFPTLPEVRDIIAALRDEEIHRGSSAENGSVMSTD